MPAFRFRCFALLVLLARLVVPATAALAPSPEEVRPLQAGAAAPTFVLADDAGQPVDLATVFSAKPTVLIFYRGGWCPFCNRHLAALAELELDLRSLGYQIVGISPDEPAKLRNTRENHSLRYRLLSDQRMQASPAYHLAYRLSPEQGRAYRANGIELPPVPGGDDFWLPVPAAFIVGRDGIVKFVYSNTDPSIRIGRDELLAAARAAAK